MKPPKPANAEAAVLIERWVPREIGPFWRQRRESVDFPAGVPR